MTLFFKWYMNVLRTHPWKTQLITTGTLMAAGDVISQLALEKKTLKNLEKKRTLRFNVLGMTFVGPAIQTWYLQLEKIFGSVGASVGLKKMLLDQVGFVPIFLCTFLVANNVMQLNSWKVTKEDLNRSYFSLLKANYVLWPAVQLVTFYVIPLNLRIVFVSSVALFWNTYLAWEVNRGKKLIPNEEERLQ